MNLSDYGTFVTATLFGPPKNNYAQPVQQAMFLKQFIERIDKIPLVKSSFYIRNRYVSLTLSITFKNGNYNLSVFCISTMVPRSTCISAFRQPDFEFILSKQHKYSSAQPLANKEEFHKYLRNLQIYYENINKLIVDDI